MGWEYKIIRFYDLDGANCKDMEQDTLNNNSGIGWELVTAVPRTFNDGVPGRKYGVDYIFRKQKE